MVKIDIYPLSIILVLGLIVSIISGLIIFINPNTYKSALAQEQEQDQNKQSALSIIKDMRGNGSDLTTNRPPLNANSTYYTFTKNRSEVSTPENNSHTGEFDKGTNIALVKPTFTAAAYNNAFYAFYSLYANAPAHVNVTTDLNLLSSKITSQTIGTIKSVFAMLELVENLKWVTQGANITILTDADVDNGAIFEKNRSSINGINAYDVIILGHQEYVTQKEYDNLRQFVRNGGTMIILDGNVFYAQVKYDKNTQTITLVKGHSWAFSDKSAWRSVGERWAKETSEWVGSNYLCYSCNIRFTNDPFEYIHHEEQYITNPHDITLLNYNASLSDYPIQMRPVIATYELNYQKGRVIALGIYSDDIISNGKFDRFFDSLLIQYASKVID